MNSSTQFAPMGRIGLFEPIHQASMWENAYKGDFSSIIGAPSIVQVDTRVDNKAEDTSYEQMSPLENNQEAVRTPDKVQRRLAQNREAARKSRLRKKAYVQQLETCRLKLTQMEQELARARQQYLQGLYIGGALHSGQIGSSFPINSVIATFEMEYGHWVEEQQRQNCELRKVFQGHIGDIELRMLVETVLNHYYNLFRMKTDAAKADVFYLMDGAWRTPVERSYHWLGGFRPSDLLNIIMPQLEPLTEQQEASINILRQSSVQAEDALTQGRDRLQHTLVQSFTADPTDPASYGSQMVYAIEQLGALEGFVNQADHLRRQTLQQMSRILTTRQAAKGLLALGEYFQRLRAVSSLWAARRSEPS